MKLKNLCISDAIERYTRILLTKAIEEYEMIWNAIMGIKVNDKRVLRFAERKILNPQLNMLTMDAHVNPQIAIHSENVLN